jgi:hypothetical protein
MNTKVKEIPKTAKTPLESVQCIEIHISTIFPFYQLILTAWCLVKHRDNFTFIE